MYWYLLVVAMPVSKPYSFELTSLYDGFIKTKSRIHLRIEKCQKLQKEQYQMHTTCPFCPGTHRLVASKCAKARQAKHIAECHLEVFKRQPSSHCPTSRGVSYSVEQTIGEWPTREPCPWSHKATGTVDLRIQWGVPLQNWRGYGVGGFRIGQPWWGMKRSIRGMGVKARCLANYRKMAWFSS